MSKLMYCLLQYTDCFSKIGIHSGIDVCQNRISQMLENTEGAANNQELIINWS